jgi:hypothetical protein
VYVNTALSYTPDVYDDNTDRGTLTITGNLSIGGTVTYEDVTNVDSLGIITARQGVHAGAGVSIVEGGLNVTAGITTLNSGSHIKSIISIGSSDTGSNKLELLDSLYANVCKAGHFTSRSEGTNSIAYAYPSTLANGKPKGNYVPKVGELITFTFVETGKETRTFIFEYENTNGDPASGKCSTYNLTDYGNITPQGGSPFTNWRWSTTAHPSSFSTDFEDDGDGYYTYNSASFYIEVGTVVSIKSAVGIGTSHPYENIEEDKGALLAVAGIVTAHNIYASKFYGSVEGGISPTGDIDIEEWIRHIGDDDTKFGFPTDNTFAVRTANVERFRIKDSGDITAGKNLEVTGVSTFSSDFSTAGITTLASDAGITTTGGRLYVGEHLGVSGISTLPFIYTDSLNSYAVSSLDIGSEDIFMVRGEFTGTTDVGTNSRALYKVGSLTEITGGYVPYDGEILTFEFSEDNKETRTFQFKYHTDYAYDEEEGCSNNATDDDYGNATRFKFSNIAYGGWSDSDNTPDWVEGSLNYYSESSSSYRIKLIPKLRTSWSVGVGTTNPIQASNQGAILGVAGIVTSHKMYADAITGTKIYGTFYGTVDGNASGTITNAKKILIEEKEDNTDYQLTFTTAANGGDADYQDLYVDTTNTDLTYNPSFNKLSTTALSIGSNLDVTGLSTFAKGGVFGSDSDPAGIGVSIHSGGLTVTTGVSTFTEGVVVTGAGVSIHSGGLNVNAGIATFHDATKTVSIGATAGSPYLQSGRGYCITGDFSSKGATSGSHVTYYQPQVEVKGSYKPVVGELITATFSEDDKDTRTFIFEYVASDGSPDSGKCSLTVMTNYEDITSAFSSGGWVFSSTALSGSYSAATNGFETYGDGYYDSTHSSFRIQVGTVLAIKSAVGIGTSNPLDPQTTDRGGLLSVAGIVTATELYGKLNGLTYPHQNGTDVYVLTSDGAGTAAWEVNPGGGSGAGSVNVAAVTPDDNTYHLTFVSGTSGAQDVKVSVGATIENNSMFANGFVARSNATQESLMNQTFIHSDGGLEIKRNYHANTSGGPYIDFTKNKFKYGSIDATSNVTDHYFACSTHIIQREWTTAYTNISTANNYISGSAHNLANGDPVRYEGVSAGDTLIGGITPGITYYAVIGDQNGNSPTTTFRLSATEADAKSGSPTIISLTGQGTGTHTFRLGTLNVGDVVKYKSGNTNLTVDQFYFVIPYGTLNFQVATSVQNALNGIKETFTQSGTNTNIFDVDTDDFDARIQLDSLLTDDASILFLTPVPGTSLPSSVGKSQERLRVTRQGAVVSGIMTVAHGSNRLDGTENYIQAGIGTHFIKQADSQQLVLDRSYRSKMIVFDKDIQTDDDKTVRIPYDVFGYGDSMTFYNAGTKICTINANGGQVRIYLAGTNVYAAAGHGATGNTGKVFLSSKAMATLTYTDHDGGVDDFVITGGGVYI